MRCFWTYNVQKDYKSKIKKSPYYNCLYLGDGNIAVALYLVLRCVYIHEWKSIIDYLSFVVLLKVFNSIEKASKESAG